MGFNIRCYLLLALHTGCICFMLAYVPKRRTRWRPVCLVTKNDIVDFKTIPNALLCLLITVLTALAARRRAFYHATDDAMWCEMRLVFWESVTMKASSWLAGLESVMWEVHSDWSRLQWQLTCMVWQWGWRFTAEVLDYLAKLLFYGYKCGAFILVHEQKYEILARLYCFGQHTPIQFLRQIWSPEAVIIKMQTREFFVSAPGKAILHGEHSVVHGKVGV